MDFTHSDDRQMLADTLGRYLAQKYDFETYKRIAASDVGFSRETWAALAELGIVGALFDEAAGGFGGTGFDIAVVFEALGRALVVEPFLGTLMAGRLIGDRTALIERVIAGTSILAFAHYEPQSRYDLTELATTAVRTDDGWVLNGSKAVVPQLEAADQILVSACTDGGLGKQAGLSLFLVPADAAGVVVRGYPLIDGGRGGELLLDGVTLDPDALVGVESDAYEAIEATIAAGIVALCAEAVGVMEVLRDATLDYLRTRTQFGVPIGKFQALQHRMATVALEIEQARSAVINAAAALAGDRWHRERAVSAAKFTIGRVGTLTAEEAIQMHGGIGMTWELPLSHYAKRLTMIDHQLGDEDHHLERYVLLGAESQAAA